MLTHSGCWPYQRDTPWCGKHCPYVNPHGNPCVLEAHTGDVHISGTPPCDPNAAIKFARSPSSGPSHSAPGEALVDDTETGHRWRWNLEYSGWEDLGPIARNDIT